MRANTDQKTPNTNTSRIKKFSENNIFLFYLQLKILIFFIKLSMLFNFEGLSCFLVMFIHSFIK